MQCFPLPTDEGWRFERHSGVCCTCINLPLCLSAVTWPGRCWPLSCTHVALPPTLMPGSPRVSSCSSGPLGSHSSFNSQFQLSLFCESLLCITHPFLSLEGSGGSGWHPGLMLGEREVSTAFILNPYTSRLPFPPVGRTQLSLTFSPHLPHGQKSASEVQHHTLLTFFFFFFTILG